jgi:glycosyltransferase involved in cell wall biosynthesis
VADRAVEGPARQLTKGIAVPAAGVLLTPTAFLFLRLHYNLSPHFSIFYHQPFPTQQFARGVFLAQPSLSLVVAVYNKSENLRLVLQGCARQSFRDFEVIIADDGSGNDVRAVVSEARESFAFPLIHLWHEDLGWRKNAMLNNAIRAARSSYLVFIDGDCIPSRHFLHDHLTQRQRGSLLLGRRVETSERWSKRISPEEVRTGRFQRLGWRELWDGVSGKSLRVEDGLRIPSGFLRRLLLRNVSGNLGSNFSVSKEDLEAVNGFDELYDGPGCGEDSDLQYRLSLIGIRGKSLRNLAVQYHLYHPATAASQKSLERFQNIQQLQVARCSQGLCPL